VGDAIESARRHSILVAFSLERNYQLPLRALQAILDGVGYAVGMDRLRTDCAWLAEQGLAVACNADVWMLTDRGLDVVMGRADTPGVQRSAPSQLNALKSALAGAGTTLARILSGG
jgi:hypothetical protein